MSHAMDHHDKTIALLGEANDTIATQAATIEALRAELRWLKGVYPNHPAYPADTGETND